MIKIAVLFFALCILGGSSAVYAADSLSTGSNQLIIKNIIIHGNHITRKRIIKLFIDIDSGSVYDSLKIKQAERKLEATRLFAKADILPIIKDDGVDLHVVLDELSYVTLTDIGGELYSFKHGIRSAWWHMRAGFENSNFRGRMEGLKTSFSFWDWRSLSLSWYKPFLTTPYFLSVGASVEQYPGDIDLYDYTDVVGRVNLGRSFFDRSKISANLTPVARKMILGFNAPSQTAQDTVERAFFEAFSSLVWVTDRRDNCHYPTHGWQFTSEAKSNFVHPGSGETFAQILLDYRFYQPALFNHTLATRIRGIARLGHSDPMHRLMVGGDYILRGHYRKEVGRSFNADNALLASAEYRIPLWQTPEYTLPAVPKFSNLPSSVYSQFHGALIFDYAHLSHNPSDMLDGNSTNSANGYGAGVGIRSVLPQFRLTVCADAVFGEKRSLTSGNFPFEKSPFFHLYVGLDY